MPNFIIPGLENYFGSKGGNGVYQQIISHITPHKVFVVPFLGHCAITRNITPADILILNDASEKVITQWSYYFLRSNIYKFTDVGHYQIFELKENKKTDDLLRKSPSIIIISKDDALHFIPKTLPEILKKYKVLSKDVFVYQDPPYPFSSRKNKKDVYEHEMYDYEHDELLSINMKMNYNTILSSYENELYDTTLENWNTHEFSAQTRNGKALEKIYYNYSLNDGLLYDYSFLEGIP